MIYGLILLVAGSVATASALPPCMCTRQYQPVCGSDGRTYDNPCMLQCAQASHSDLSMAKTGTCADEDKPCVCTYEYEPVCGSDGKTYPNKCMLNCQRSVRLVADGPCPETESLKLELPQCVCTYEYDPVCGSDGKTYPNKCALNCQRSVRLVGDGPCPETESLKLELPPCVCTREARPVCGSDGVTYANPCLLNCATATNPKLSLKSYGRCADEGKVADEVKVAEIKKISCACTRNMQLVCGSDGKTYNNPCLLNCATATNPQLSLKSYGPCAEEVKVAELNCACTRNMQLVCGSDGKTYNNPCLLNCATATNPQLSLKSYGPCAEEVKGADEVKVAKLNCACTRNMQPVCGSDGKTYNNLCLLNCATKTNPSLSIVRQGRCEGENNAASDP